jgi:hypothetical protein
MPSLMLPCKQAHDFFTPQPILDASIFLLRVVLHDWPDSFARKILLRLREAAVVPSTSGDGSPLSEDERRR